MLKEFDTDVVVKTWTIKLGDLSVNLSKEKPFNYDVVFIGDEPCWYANCNVFDTSIYESNVFHVVGCGKNPEGALEDLIRRIEDENKEIQKVCSRLRKFAKKFEGFKNEF